MERNGRSSLERQGIIAFCTCQWNEQTIKQSGCHNQRTCWEADVFDWSMLMTMNNQKTCKMKVKPTRKFNGDKKWLAVHKHNYSTSDNKTRKQGIFDYNTAEMSQQMPDEYISFLNAMYVCPHAIKLIFLHIWYCLLRKTWNCTQSVKKFINFFFFVSRKGSCLQKKVTVSHMSWQPNCPEHLWYPLWMPIILSKRMFLATVQMNFGSAFIFIGTSCFNWHAFSGLTLSH